MTENNLKQFFREARNYFAGNVTGVTRDETIADIVIGLLLCKIFDEERRLDQQTFKGLSKLPESEVARRLLALEAEVVAQFPGAFDRGSALARIDSETLCYLGQALSDLRLGDFERDVVADAFEEFIGTSYRGGEGQFFTPKNIVKMMVEVLDPKSHEKIIDPACGSGGFLIETLRHLGKKATVDSVFGIDKDQFLARIANSYLSILLRSEANVFCENSLSSPAKWHKKTQEHIALGSFDLVLTNPPFGAKIPVLDRDVLAQFDLGHEKQAEQMKLRGKQSPQVLFIERAVQLLKPGGRLGIVLPEGIFGNPSDAYIWEFLQSKGSITGIVGLSQEAFQPSTHTKTSVLFFEKKIGAKKIFMANAEKVGHNKNGKTLLKYDSVGNPLLDNFGEPIIDDDLPEISRAFIGFRSGQARGDHLGFDLPANKIQSNIFIPDYYNPELQNELSALEKSGQFELVTIGELVDKKHLKIRRGKEIGSHLYGTGSIPFVRTSDITNWEIKFDPIKSVSEEAYQRFKKQMDVEPNDIFLVSDGTFLIGRTAMVTRATQKILYQSHLKKIRVMPSSLIDSYYLLYLLSTDLVQRQIKSKTFVQATISTLGERLLEIKLPISHNKKLVGEISNKVKKIIEAKIEIREKTIELIGEQNAL